MKKWLTRKNVIAALGFIAVMAKAALEFLTKEVPLAFA